MMMKESYTVGNIVKIKSRSYLDKHWDVIRNGTAYTPNKYLDIYLILQDTGMFDFLGKEAKISFVNGSDYKIEGCSGWWKDYMFDGCTEDIYLSRKEG